MKTKLLLIISLTQFIMLSAKAQWTLTTVDTNYFLSKLIFVNDSTGFAAGSIGLGKGILLKTTNKGISWDTTTFSQALLSVFFPNADTGYASCEGMYKTTDGGNSWSQLSYNFPSDICGRGLFFLSADTGFVGGGNTYVLYRTYDGGNTWSTHNYLPVSDCPDKIYFTDADTGFMAGYYGPTIAKTTDSGNTWQNISNAYSVFDFQFVSKTIAFAVGTGDRDNAVILKSTDGANTWNVVDSEATIGYNWFNSIYCTDINTCIAAGDSGIIVKTTDGGAHWTKETSGTIQRINSIVCPDNNTCYAVGDSGVILKNTTINTGINETAQQKSMISIYPNPVSSTLYIHAPASFNKQNASSIQITDVTGRALYEASLTGADNTIDVSKWSNGIYFYQVRNETQTMQGRFVIEK